jgi:hypothetical protein
MDGRNRQNMFLFFIIFPDDEIVSPFVYYFFESEKEMAVVAL